MVQNDSPARGGSDEPLEPPPGSAPAHTRHAKDISEVSRVNLFDRTLCSSRAKDGS